LTLYIIWCIIFRWTWLLNWVKSKIPHSANFSSKKVSQLYRKWYTKKSQNITKILSWQYRASFSACIDIIQRFQCGCTAPKICEEIFYWNQLTVGQWNSREIIEGYESAVNLQVSTVRQSKDKWAILLRKCRRSYLLCNNEIFSEICGQSKSFPQIFG